MAFFKSRLSADLERTVQNEALELGDLVTLNSPVSAKHEIRATTLSIVSHLLNSALSATLRFIRYPPPGSLRLRGTSWLDGVRGVAALAVFVFHAMGCWASLVPAWRADEEQTSILQLPLVRTIFVAGGGAVSVFFVLSGYVLTHRCLRLIRAGSGHEVYPAVASSMFRRGFRLYLPPILLTFCEMLATRFGFVPPLNFEFTPEPTLLGQLWDWLVETNRLVNPIHNFWRAVHGFVTHPKYDAVIWTIPVEFYGSMVCYILLLASARVSSSRLRMGSVAMLSLLGMAMGCWNVFCFTAGMLIADFNLGQELDNAATNPFSSGPTVLWGCAFAASFYALGFPTLVYEDGRTKPMPGFETMRALIPTHLDMEDHARFWWSIAGVVLLLSISQVPRLKAVFETYLCQYLARISFSLYLVHEFFIVLFGLRLQTVLKHVAGVDGASEGNGVSYWLVCVTWFALFTVPVFALAAQVERWVDVPSVRFSKWLEAKCWKMYRGLN